MPLVQGGHPAVGSLTPRLALQDPAMRKACARASCDSRNGRPGRAHSTISTRRGNRVRSCAGTDSATKSNASVSAGNCLYAASPVPSMPGNISEGGRHQIVRLHVCIGAGSAPSEAHPLHVLHICCATCAALAWKVQHVGQFQAGCSRPHIGHQGAHETWRTACTSMAALYHRPHAHARLQPANTPHAAVCLAAAPAPSLRVKSPRPMRLEPLVFMMVC